MRPLTYFPSTRIESHDQAVSRLAAIAREVAGVDDFDELTVEGRTKADVGYPHPLLNESPPADCRLPANPCTDVLEAKTGECAAGTDSAPEPAPVTPIGSAGAEMDGSPLCVAGASIWQTHDTGMGRKCRRCGWAYPKLLVQ